MGAQPQNPNQSCGGKRQVDTSSSKENRGTIPHIPTIANLAIEERQTHQRVENAASKSAGTKQEAGSKAHVSNETEAKQDGVSDEKKLKIVARLKQATAENAGKGEEKRKIADRKKERETSNILCHLEIYKRAKSREEDKKAAKKESERGRKRLERSQLRNQPRNT